MARKAGGYYASGQPPTSLAMVWSGPGWEEAMHSIPAMLNHEASFRLGAYYAGFPFSCRTEALVSSLLSVRARHRPLVSLHAPRQESFLFFWSSISCLHFRLFLSAWHCGFVYLKGGEGIQHRAGLGGQWGGEGCVCAAVTMTPQAGGLSHPQLTLITSCLSFSSSSDT